MAYGETNKAYSDQKNWSNTYLTDPKLLDILGPFDTDPCVHTEMPWKTADVMYNINDNGLEQEWKGRVFMNPPYRHVMSWAEKFVQCHSGIALINGRSPETRATQLMMKNSYCVWFPQGRLTFYKPDGSPFEQKWFPSILIGLTPEDHDAFSEASRTYNGVILINDK